MRKALDCRKKNLPCISSDMKFNKSIESADFSLNPLTSFRNLPSLELLKKLNFDSTQITTFKYAPILPNLEIFSCRNTPLANHQYLSLMAAIVFNDRIKFVNGEKVPVNACTLASMYSQQVRKYFVDGNIILNLNPLTLLNPETRRRKAIFIDFSGFLYDEPIPIQEEPENSQPVAHSHIPSSHSHAKDSSSVTQRKQVQPVATKIPAHHTNTSKSHKAESVISSSHASNAKSNLSSARSSRVSNVQYQKDSISVSSRLTQKETKAQKQAKAAENERLEKKFFEMSKSLWRETVVDRSNAQKSKKLHKKVSDEAFYAKPRPKNDEPFIIEIEDENPQQEEHPDSINEAPQNTPEEENHEYIQEEEDVTEQVHEEDINVQQHEEEIHDYIKEDDDVTEQVHEEEINEQPHEEEIHEPTNEEDIHEQPHEEDILENTNQQEIHEPTNEEDIHEQPHEEDILENTNQQEIHEPINESSNSPSPHKEKTKRVPRSPESVHGNEYYSDEYYYSDEGK